METRLLGSTLSKSSAFTNATSSEMTAFPPVPTLFFQINIGEFILYLECPENALTTINRDQSSSVIPIH